MLRPLRLLPLALAATTVAAGSAMAQGGGGGAPPPTATPPAPAPKLVVQRPHKRLFVQNGPSGRLMLDGTWYFRQDDALVGDRSRFFAQNSLAGWTKVFPPHNWNGADLQFNYPSVGWYRKEFKLPGKPKRLWRIRFEGVNHRATVFLNGKKLGVHSPAYLPFEMDLPNLRKGRNRLVVKVSTLRSNTDLTHWRPAAVKGFGSSGWWNFGGLSREVYVRPVNRLDVPNVRVQPEVRRPGSPARVRVTTTVRNAMRRKQRVSAALLVKGPGGFSERVVSRPFDVEPGTSRDTRASFTIPRPRLWQPGRPALYSLTASVASAGKRRASYRTKFGVKHVAIARDGRMFLNGRKLNLRGASIHEDQFPRGAALTPANRRSFINQLRKVGGNFSRAHYPLHPSFMEAFDRLGIVYWSQAPVYQVPTANMARVRRSAVAVNEDVVRRDQNHPSVLVWSIANELPDEEGAVQGQFIAEASRAVKRLDRTRPVAIDRQSQLGQPDPAPAINRHIDAIGLNEYFGWYGASLRPDPRRPGRYIPSTSADLLPFLDLQNRAYPGKAIFITEMGAEANRPGPATEKGTFEFQNAYTAEHLKAYTTRRYVNGALVWALKDFRVTPTWNGGNPRPNPPWHNKSLVEENGKRKPIWFVVRALFARVKPLGRKR